MGKEKEQFKLPEDEYFVGIVRYTPKSSNVEMIILASNKSVYNLQIIPKKELLIKRLKFERSKK